MRSSAVLVLLLAAACDSATRPAFPTDAVQYEPLGVYGEWWRLVESCAGLRGDLSEVRWYQAPNASLRASFGRAADAYWTGDGNRILMTSGRAGDGPLVRHEMLHALLRAGGHSRAYYMQRCGGIVACQGECLTDAGPAPLLPSSWRRIPPESLEVTSDVSPAVPGASVWGGYFMFAVHARNPYNEPVVVVLPPSADAGAPLSFEFWVDVTYGRGTFMTYNERADDGGIVQFAPGERKQIVFDFFVGHQRWTFPLTPGDWILRGFFGKHPAAPIRVTISP